MTSSKDFEEKIQVQLSYGLLQKVKNQNKKVKLFFTETEIFLLDIESVQSKNFNLLFSEKKANPFKLGGSYALHFELGGVNHTGSVHVEKTGTSLILHFERDLSILHRRNDFRVTPPNKEEYFVNIKGLDSIKLQVSMGFIDLSLGGVKLTIPKDFDETLLKNDCVLNGELVLKDVTVVFNGIIKTVTDKFIGVQFKDLGLQGKDIVWREVMKWYRYHKNNGM